MTRPLRLTAIHTHPVQYFAPWYRFVEARCPEIDLDVWYATEPTPAQQGVGFGHAFEWDVPLNGGYRSRVARPPRPEDDLRSSRFWGVDVPQLAEALAEARPDVVLINGWHSATLVRALFTARRLGIPALYRGDTNSTLRPRGARGWAWTAKTWGLLRLYRGYLSVGVRAREYLRRFGIPEARIFDAPHAIDNDFFRDTAAPFQTAGGRAEARRAFGLGAEKFAVLFVGKVEAMKRPLDLVRAVAKLGPGASLLFVGSGDLVEACKLEAKALQVDLVLAGFLNQTELGKAYAAADCLALGSTEGETWGLVVNEALATGLPAVVSDRVGCGPDLVTPGETGATFEMGDVEALAAALARVRVLQRNGHDFAPACRERIERYSFDAATRGLLEACRAVTPPPRSTFSVGRKPLPRVVMCGGSMVIVAGAERMTFEVLRGLSERGAVVHCIVNSWENHRILPLVGEIGASWSTGFYWYRFDRHTRNPLTIAQFGWDVLRTSLGLLRDGWRLRATHVLLPEFVAALRNAPALLVLRFLGIPVVLRVANHPDAGRFYQVLWGFCLPPLVSSFVANSRFATQKLLEAGVPERKVVTIHNSVSRRRVPPGTDAEVVELARSRRTVLSVGQIAPFKGTHLVVDSAIDLLKGGADVQAVVVGRIPEWPPSFVEYVAAMRAKAASSGFADRIHFVGERLNVLDIMRASYVLATPILQEETFGNVALEAKSVGLPVVAFRTGGLIELVDHRVTGFLCRSSTLEGLLEGLLYFLDDVLARERASAASLAALGGPDCEYGRDLFHDRWWSVFTSEGDSP